MSYLANSLLLAAHVIVTMMILHFLLWLSGVDNPKLYTVPVLLVFVMLVLVATVAGIIPWPWPILRPMA